MGIHPTDVVNELQTFYSLAHILCRVDYICILTHHDDFADFQTGLPARQFLICCVLCTLSTFVQILK